MTAPDMRGAAQGDPRARRQGRSSSIRAAPRPPRRADRHLFIRPGTDAVLLLAMVARAVRRAARAARARVARRRARRARARGRARGRPSAPRRSPASPPTTIRELAPRARDDAARRRSTAASACARRSSAGSRAWLVYAINALTGHLDEPGGLMFTTPAVDPLPLAQHARLRRRLRALAQPRVAASPSSAASCRWPRSPRRSRRRGERPDPRADHERRQPGAVDAGRPAPRARARRRSTSWSRSIRTSTRPRATRT